MAQVNRLRWPLNKQKTRALSAQSKYLDFISHNDLGFYSILPLAAVISGSPVLIFSLLCHPQSNSFIQSMIESRRCFPVFPFHLPLPSFDPRALQEERLMGRDLVSLYMWHYGDCLFIFEDGRPSNFRWMGYLYECLWFSMTFWYSESERARAWRTWFANIACSYDDYNLLPSIPGLIKEGDILTWSRSPISNNP